MKNSKIIAALAVVLFLSFPVLAETTNKKEKTNFEVWDYGNDPLEEVLEMEAIPAIRISNT